MTTPPSQNVPVRMPVIGLAVAVTVMSTLPIVLIAAVAPLIREEVGFGAGGLGAASAVFFGVGSVTAALSGRLTQALGVTRAMRATAGLSALAMVATPLLATTLPRLLGCLALAGFANSIAHPSANWALTLSSPQSNRGLMFGIKQAAVPMASLLAGMSVPLLAVRSGWRLPFLVGAAAAAVLALAVAPLVPRAWRARTPVRDRSRRRCMARGTLTVAVAGALGSSAAVSIGTFVVDSTVAAGWTPAAAGRFLAVCGVVGVVVRIGSGWAVDRWRIPGRNAVGSLMGAGAAGLLIVVAGAEVDVLLGLGLLLGYGAGWGWGGLLHHVIATENPDGVAAATGFVQGGIFAGGALGPLAFGALVEQTSYDIAWLVAAGALTVSASGLLLAARGQRMHHAKAARV